MVDTVRRLGEDPRGAWGPNCSQVGYRTVPERWCQATTAASWTGNAEISITLRVWECTHRRGLYCQGNQQGCLSQFRNLLVLGQTLQSSRFWCRIRPGGCQGSLQGVWWSHLPCPRSLSSAIFYLELLTLPVFCPHRLSSLRCLRCLRRRRPSEKVMVPAQLPLSLTIQENLPWWWWKMSRDYSGCRLRPPRYHCVLVWVL